MGYNTAMNERPDFGALVKEFDHANVAAVVLMGSYARGAAGPYSDVDLVRFTMDDEVIPPGGGSHLIDGRLVVVSNVTPTQVEDAFTRPEVAVETIQGLRSGRALIDRDGFFRTLQQRANAFQWDEEMQNRADHWASRQMVGWIEEVHKGLEGLCRGDTGRLLHARFGCSWGLARVLCVQRGVLLSGDNALFEEVIASVGPDSEWTHLCRSVYGAGSEPSTLEDQVKAGLQLYSLTAALLAGILLEEDQPLIANTVSLINEAI
jgi:hypothetical protein